MPELEQLRRLQRLDSLLPAIADVLDLREVFEHISTVTRAVLPHERLSILLIDAAGETFELHAAAGEPTPEFPTRSLDAIRLPAEPWQYQIFPDILSDGGEDGGGAPFPALKAHAERMGLHSLLRVPIRLAGRMVGTLNFLARRSDRYRESDVLVANRIRDHVALALSHRKLAEESRRAERERERAAEAEARVAALAHELAAVDGPRLVAGGSESFRAVLAQATAVARTETTVLLTGESGTGKEVVARLIHRGSPRAAGPFVAINCAALPESLLESEVFGYEKGAFSGAGLTKPGSIELAAGGVLFLDEIGEMSLAVQAKLLRFLQEREFQRLGGTRVLKADVRVIAATNRDLRGATRRGEFREDLFYRVSVFELRVPPLRERRADVLPLADAFLRDLARALARPRAVLSDAARETLLSYRWPGNVRELHNALERAAILCDAGRIEPADLGLDDAPATAESPAPLPRVNATDDLRALERETIERVLQAVRFNKSAAARRLGISRGKLYAALKRHAL